MIAQNSWVECMLRFSRSNTLDLCFFVLVDLQICSEHTTYRFYPFESLQWCGFFEIQVSSPELQWYGCRTAHLERNRNVYCIKRLSKVEYFWEIFRYSGTMTVHRLSTYCDDIVWFAKRFFLNCIIYQSDITHPNLIAISA